MARPTLPPPADAERYRFEIGNDAAALMPLLCFLAERVAAHGGPSALGRSTLPLVLDEVLTNAWEHGNRWHSDKRVCVEVEISENVLTLRVSDEGEGFERSSVADPRQDDRRRASRGRGLYLVERLMDAVHYEDGGRTIVLRKGLRAPGSGRR